MSRASEWREKAKAAQEQEAVELTLPSGAKVLAQRPGMPWLASRNKLPAGLASAASGAEADALTAERIIEHAAFMRELLIYVCVDPRITLDPAGPDEIHPQEIPQADWLYLANWAMRVEEGRALEGFRGQRADAGRGGDGEGVRVQTF